MKKLSQFLLIGIFAISFSSCEKQNEMVDAPQKKSATTYLTLAEALDLANASPSAPPVDHTWLHPNWDAEKYYVEVNGSYMEIYNFANPDDLENTVESEPYVTTDHTYNDCGGNPNTCGGKTVECSGAEKDCYWVENDNGLVLVTCDTNN